MPNPGFEQIEGVAAAARAAGWGGGAFSSNDAHSGRAAALLRSDGTMPSLMQVTLGGVRSGRLTFWYKALEGASAFSPLPESSLRFDVIPVDANGKESPAHDRRVYAVPAAEIGDGRWHRGEIVFNYLDQPVVASVVVGPRVNELNTSTMPTGPSAILFDDLGIAPLGPLARLGMPVFMETPGQEGEDGRLVCELFNDGDAPMNEVIAALSLPKDADLATTEPVRRVEALAPKAAVRFAWGVRGRRAGRTYPLAIDLQARAVPAAHAVLVLRPAVELRELAVPSLVLWQGARQDVSVVVANVGHAAASDVRVDLRAPRAARCVAGAPSQAIDTLPPGATRPLTWTLAGVEPEGLQALTVSAASAGDTATSTTARRELIVSRRVAADSTAATSVTAARRAGQDLILENARLRLLFPKNPAGFGPAEVQVRQDGAWRPVGVMPWLARVRFRGLAERTIEHAFAASVAATASSSGASTLTLAARWRDQDGGAWRCDSVFSLARGARWVDAATTLTVDRPRDLLLAEGAVLLAGEGTTGRAKDLALFPGLDFIGAVERSSAIWNPNNLEKDQRVAPDPLKITIPFMAVSVRGAAVGLMWNALDRWDGTHDSLSARFLSPDFEENHAHHWMSLFAPTVPEWVDENTREAARPYRLQPDRPLRFRYQVVAHAPASVLDVQRDWLDRHGPPAVPPKPWSYEQFIRLALDADNALRFEADRQTWFHGGPGMTPGEGQFNPQLATDMWIDSIRTTDTARRAAWRERVMKTARTHSDDLELNLPFHIGLLAPAIDGNRRFVGRIMEEQLPGGGWPLKKHAGLPEWIGQDGAVASGTCALAARRLMEYARVTGAPDAYAAARRGLAALERDPIPRGGQTWEVPVQVADVIVAGHAARPPLHAVPLAG
ncbi:MAG: hypothetical protein M1457_02780, partial [bacterium]|nr:hypothetical protein [bacterium]